MSSLSSIFLPRKNITCNQIAVNVSIFIPPKSSNEIALEEFICASLRTGTLKITNDLLLAQWGGKKRICRFWAECLIASEPFKSKQWVGWAIFGRIRTETLAAIWFQEICFPDMKFLTMKKTRLRSLHQTSNGMGGGGIILLELIHILFVFRHLFPCYFRCAFCPEVSTLRFDVQLYQSFRNLDKFHS